MLNKLSLYCAFASKLSASVLARFYTREQGEAMIIEHRKTCTVCQNYK